MSNRKKTKPKHKSAVPPKYNVGMPNPYTKGSEIHKLWDLVATFPHHIAMINASGVSFIGATPKNYKELVGTYSLIGMDGDTIRSLVPPVVLTWNAEAPFYTFKVHLPKKHYQLFRSLRTHCLNLKNGDYTSMSGLEYGNT